MTTKILALTDALGNLVRFVLLPGHRFDTVLIDGLSLEGFIEDKAYDSNSMIACSQRARRQDRNLSAAPASSPGAPRLPIEAEIYRWRHLIETSSASSRNSNASRADKTDQSFAANIHLAAAEINSLRPWKSPSDTDRQAFAASRRRQANAVGVRNETEAGP